MNACLATAEKPDAIAGFVPPSEDWIPLQAASLRFLETPFFDDVTRQGWSALEIWGCYPSARLDAVRLRYDAQGLVVALTLGRGCTLIHIGPDHAVVSRKATGARLRHRRALTGPAALWWHAPYAEAQ